MATLTVNGRKVKVDDSFLSLPPDQQEATVNEIAASLGPDLPSGAQLQGKVADLPSRQPAPTPRPDLLSSTMATVNGLSASVPGLQNLTDAMGGTVAQLTGGNYADYVEHQKAVREGFAKQAPLARLSGEIGGTVGGLGALGATRLGAEALGMSGQGLGKLVNAGLSSQGLYTADQLTKGKSGLEATGYGLPVLAGVGGSLAGDFVSGVGGKVADAFTAGAQRNLTKKAIVGAPSATDLKSAASQMFEASTGGKPLMVNDTAYFRFLGDVKHVADKFRINADNDQQSVGLLNTLMRIADETATGTKVDMKDLHLIRQLAGSVADSPQGRDAAFGRSVISKMDDFIKTLKPSDILGGGDPRQAANDLMMGISTWSRASKVAAVEKAINAGQVAASGPEKGIRNALRALVKDEQTWKTFTKAEQRAILDVVEGTPGSNLLKLIGTFGFGANTATNGIGGAAGMMIGNSLAPGIGLVLGPAIGAAAKKGSEAMTTNLARRALGAAATPGVPIAKQAPNLLAGAKRPIDLLIRGGALSGQ
jgi:hypothetical protein